MAAKTLPETMDGEDIIRGQCGRGRRVIIQPWRASPSERSEVPFGGAAGGEVLCACHGGRCSGWKAAAVCGYDRLNHGVLNGLVILAVLHSVFAGSLVKSDRNQSVDSVTGVSTRKVVERFPEAPPDPNQERFRCLIK